MGIFGPQDKILTQTYVQYIVVNVISTLMTAGAHNSMYFMLGLSSWLFHFLHYFFTFFALMVCVALRITKFKRLPLRQIAPISVSQFVVSAATSYVHSGGKDGALYTLRIADFAITGLVMFATPLVLDPERFATKREYRSIVCAIAISSSLAWLEPGFMETRLFAIACLPIIVAASAFHQLVTLRTQLHLGVTIDQLLIYHSALTSVLLLPAALIFTSDSFNSEIVSGISSWELADYGIICMSVACMTGMIYSKYWLMVYCSPEGYNIIRHGRYTLASCGQWIVQNMAWATSVSAISKALSMATICFYFHKRYKETKTENVAKNLTEDNEHCRNI